MEGADFREKLDRFRVDIVQTLDLQRQFIFCYLRSKAILDEEDCERILEAGAGRQQKVSKFLDVLSCKGAEGYQCFIESLEIEHPNLYEKMTGKRAAKRPKKSELFDFDRQFLANQLEKATTDLQALTYMHNKMVHEKSQLERRMIETVGDLENEQMRTRELREEMMSMSNEARGSRTSVESLQPAQQYVQELIAENADKSNIIISLQQTLLSAVSKAEQDKATMDELQRRQEEHLQQIRDLTINYDWERRNSRKMGEKICRQNDQIRQGDDLRREIFELKLKLSEMQEQRDDAREELREFRNVTEALNAKFDTVRKEKDLAIGIKENFTGTVLELDEQVQSLQMKLRKANFEYKELERKFARQSQEITTLREQRDVLLQERQVAIQERTAACKERDEALKMNQELQNSRDEAIEAQIKINKSSQDDYAMLEKELEALRCEYNELVKQFEMAQFKLEQGEKEKRLAPYYRAVSAPMQGSRKENPNDVDDGETGAQRKQGSYAKEHSATDASPKDSIGKEYPWKSRSNSSVLSSAYRRINESTMDTHSRHRSSMPLLFSACDKDTFERVIGPYKIKSQPEDRNSAEYINFSVDDVNKDSRDSNTVTADNEAKADSTGGQREVNQSSAKTKGTSLLSVSVGNSKDQRGKVKSAPPSPKAPLSPNNRQQKETEVLSCIVPCISDLSLNLVMKSGSQESLVNDSPKQKGGKTKKSEEKATSALMKSAFMSGGLLTCAEPKLKSPGKSVAPKLLYKVGMGTATETNLQVGSKNGEKEELSSKSSDSLKVRHTQRRHSTCGTFEYANGSNGFTEV